jgi:hypothetical protein
MHEADKALLGRTCGGQKNTHNPVAAVAGGSRLKQAM